MIIVSQKKFKSKSIYCSNIYFELTNKFQGHATTDLFTPNQPSIFLWRGGGGIWLWFLLETATSSWKPTPTPLMDIQWPCNSLRALKMWSTYPIRDPIWGLNQACSLVTNTIQTRCRVSAEKWNTNHPQLCLLHMYTDQFHPSLHGKWITGTPGILCPDTLLIWDNTVYLLLSKYKEREDLTKTQSAVVTSTGLHQTDWSIYPPTPSTWPRSSQRATMTLLVTRWIRCWSNSRKCPTYGVV